MNPYASYKAINAKIHSKKKIFLTNDEWDSTVNFESIDDMIKLLARKAGYRRVMLEIGTPIVHRGDLEYLLDKYVIKEIQNLQHYFSADYKKFINTFLMEYCIRDLQLILRSIARKEKLNKKELNIELENNKIGIPYDRLLKCESIEEVHQALENTIYKKSIVNINKSDIKNREFHIEMKLYILFFTTLMKEASKLNKDDSKEATQIIGTKIDIMNAIWIYRAKKYYSISKEEILIYSIPYGYKLSYQKLKEIIYIDDINILKQKLSKVINADIFAEIDDLQAMRSNQYMLNMSRKIKKVDNSIQGVILYIYRLGIEVDELVAITEGIRYKLSPKELRKYLFLKSQIKGVGENGN